MTEWREVVWRGETLHGYTVSDDGRVIGLKGYELRQGPDGDGYMRIGAAGHVLGVHVLVCEAWHGPRPTPKHEVAHHNGVKADNRADNLRWATKSENAADSIRLGERPSGEGHPDAKLTWAQVREIRFQYEWGGISQYELADQYGISRVQIGKIVRGVHWRNDPEDAAS